MGQDEPPGGEEDPAPTAVPVMESLLLSVAIYWSRKETADRVVELLERHFRQDEMYAAHKDLMEVMKRNKPSNRQQGAGRTAAKAQAMDLHGAIC